MGVALAGQLYLSLVVDGAEVPVGNSAAMKVFINSNVKTLLPSIHIELPDPLNLFTKNIPINDGSVIQVILHDDQQAPFDNYSSFRTIGTPQRTPMGQLLSYKIPGLLDAIPYIRGNPQQAINGPSTTVMQGIAQAMNFKYIGDVTTNDAMNWLPGRKTWGTFMQHVTQHAWIGDKSALTSAVDEQRQLHFFDINNMFANGQIKAHLVYGGPSDPSISNSTPLYPVTHYRNINRSGILNNMHGYGLRLTEHDITTGNVNKFIQNQAMTISNAIDISKIVLGQIDNKARIDILPFTTGNTHENYMQARHQNLRTASFYAQNTYILVPHCTGLNLHDMVAFEVNTANFIDAGVSGIYAITNITRAMINNRYVEKLEITSSGPANENISLV